ncbi:TMEM165/GDT1 family protein [Haloarchaeobius amylolyticus]|uniref:TMEM165/GDT1 family protein n=1 Tax=Haloarchaeobius amylolyticus TaxID=1198296 RepID=UPI00226D58C2|nr:TMEM165/GDT1 family protein [Haloarchaeobius amylolyticus]
MEYLEIVAIAFVAQLAVLPGEKVQFIIAGLSTRYHPAVVVSAAGTAFAGWTALEIAFGNAVKQALPPVVLTVISGLLFCLFAVLLYRSMPASDEAAGSPADPESVETDGGFAGMDDDETFDVFGHEVPQYFGGWLPIFGMMAVGEFGDKTQLVTIGLAIEYGATSAIWVGEMLAIIPVSIANALLFYRFSNAFDARLAHLFSAGLFAFFGIDTLQSVVTGFSVWETLVEMVASQLTAVLDAVLALV